MPILLEVVYIAQMWVGRLEFIAVAALIGFAASTVFGK
jgi:Trk-type K+ transport system membrane component